MHEAPSAGTGPGSVWCRHPSTRSGMNCPMVWRMATGAGNGALTMQPSGALTTKGASEPALFGMSGPTTQRIPNTL